MKIKFLKLIFAISILLFFNNCGQEKKVIEHDYSLITTDVTIDNQEALSGINTFFEENKDPTKPEASTYQKVNIHEEIATLFAPEGTLPCDLPNKAKKKINKTKNWTPRLVKTNLNNIPKEGDKVPNVSVLRYLNSISIIPVTGEPYEIQINSSPELDMTNFIDQELGRFAYSLDCSGYLNAALEFEAGGSAANIRNSASSSLKNDGTVLLVRASVIPPIVEAVRKTLPPKSRMQDIDVFTLLVGLKNELKTNSNEGDKLDISKILDLLWTSNEGNSSFNGEASLSGGARFMGIKFSGGAGASLARTSNFTNFDTYVLNEKVSRLASPIKIKEVNTILLNLTKSAQVVTEPKTVNSDLTFELLMPSDLAKGWTLKGVQNAVVVAEKEGTNKIKFTISNIPSGTTSITLTRNFKGLNLEKVLRI